MLNVAWGDDVLQQGGVVRIMEHPNIKLWAQHCGGVTDAVSARVRTRAALFPDRHAPHPGCRDQ